MRPTDVDPDLAMRILAEALARSGEYEDCAEVEAALRARGFRNVSHRLQRREINRLCKAGRAARLRAQAMAVAP